MHGGSNSTKNTVFDRKGNENYKSSSRVTHHHAVRGQSSGLHSNIKQGHSGTPTQANLNGIIPNHGHGANSAPRTGTASSNRNAAIFGLKSETTLDFGMPTTTTTASSDTNMLFNRNPSSQQHN